MILLYSKIMNLLLIPSLRLEQQRLSFMQEALLAFKLFEENGVKYYTCNVERLEECNRLGDDKQVSLWRTHFFLRSSHFDGVKSVIFSKRPGTELALAAKTVMENIFLKITPNQAVNVSNGDVVDFDKDIPFNSEC